VSVIAERRPAVDGPSGQAADGSVEPSGRMVAWILLGLTAVSVLVRIAQVSKVQAPTVFNDELIYERLAYSIGHTGHASLFEHRGWSYSPLYPLVLSPIYALGASAPTAYALTKIVNAILVSLSIVPAYKIARFVLPRRLSLLVALLCGLVPALNYSAFMMTENLAYPLCLITVWAMLAAIRVPRPRNDLLLLCSIGLATAARVQLIVLVPVALTAIMLAALLAPAAGAGRRRVLLDMLKAHWLLFGATAAAVLVAGAAALAGPGVFVIGSSYTAVQQGGLPNVGHLLKHLVEHVAELDLAVGLVPFAGALVAAYVFVRSKARLQYVGFAAVATSLTAWLLLETAYLAAKLDSSANELPRIHERFLIYVVPLFLVALVAAWRVSGDKALGRVYLGAAVVVTVLPALIPYHTVINNTVGVDTFSIQPLSRVRHGFEAIPYAPLIAVWFAGTFSLLYWQVRGRLRTVVILVLLPFAAVFVLVRSHIQSSSAFARSVLPKAHADWVDRAVPQGDVTLLTGRATAAALETTFMNLSVAHAYTTCGTLGSDFGEQQVTIRGDGRLRAGSRDVRARYVVAPTTFHIPGRVLARNRKGHQVLVAPTGGRLTVDPAVRATLRKCLRRT
jgi:hypothetical protein